MPSDYQRISEENGRKYGTDIGRIGPTLLGNRYADRTHFVFELLQNAEDALRRRGGAEGSGRVRFALANGAVRFSHFGLPFTPDDVRAVCGIIEGTKEDDLIAIGRFGIGFKSVYAVTDLPQIHSGDEHFAVRDYVHPAAVAPIPLADGEMWLVFSREVHHEGTSAGYAELAFRITTANDGSEAIHVIGDSPLAAFFPTVIETHLGMLVQGPYRTTPSRETIPWADDWNRHLVEETASLLVDALRHLRDRGLLGVHVFDALPLSRQRFAGGFFEPMFDAVREAVASEPLLPAHRGGYVPASQARLTDEPGLRNLVSRRQLADLVGEDEPVAWLAAEITRDETRDLHRYLTGEHGVPELNAEDLLLSLDKPFIEAQPDRWIRRLYEFLGREDIDSYDYLLDDVPLIRLEDGTHIAWRWGEPVAFLPTEPPSGFPNTVHPAVCESAPAREFLKSLGVTEPDQVDELVRSVIPRYRNQEVTKKSVYAIDVRRIAEILGEASRERRGRLVEALRDTPFVRVVDAGTGERSFVRPEDAYLATKQLRDLFEGVPSALLVDRSVPRLGGEAMSDLLEECRASRTLKPITAKRDARLSRFTSAELRKMREATRWKSSTGRESVTDYEFRGLEALLDYLVDLPVEEAVTRAERLWGVLRESSGSRQWTRGRYEWHYYTSRSRGFESTAVRLLNNTAWVPDGSGGRRPPNRVEFAPLGWTRDAFLESIIKFRQPQPPSSRAVAAREMGVGVDVLEEVAKLKEQGASDDEIREALSGVSRRRAPPGPTRDGGPNATRGGAPAGPRSFGGLTPVPGGDASAGGGPPGGDGSTGGSGTESGRTRGASAGARGAGASGGSSGTGVTRYRFVSYISVRTESEGEQDPDGLDHRARMDLEEAAIAHILAKEPALQRTPTNNPGFDLYQANESGTQVRWVEVKAMSGDMRSRPATLSHTQFEHARKHGAAYWLYVVEHAGTDRARIVRINDPAGRASTYTFDEGWREAAEGASE